MRTFRSSSVLPIVLLALALAGARLAFANPPEAGTPPDDAERVDARTLAELRAENERLLRELATLRQTVTRTALPDGVEGSKGSDSTDGQQSDGKPEGFAVSKLDLEILELELREQVQLGILAKHFESMPEEFLWFVADVWISAYHPERAYRLCCQLREVVAPPELLLSIGMSLGDPSDEMLWAYAQGLRGAGRHDEAVAVSEQLWQQTPNRSNSSALLDAHPEIWIDRITLQARSGNVREPDEVLGGVGIKLLELGRIDEAITLLREAARIDPDDGEWQSRLQDAFAALRSR